MTDPRDIANDNNVPSEKKHQGDEVPYDVTHAVQPGQKPHQQSPDPATSATTPATDAQAPLDRA